MLNGTPSNIAEYEFHGPIGFQANCPASPTLNILIPVPTRPYPPAQRSATGLMADSRAYDL